MTRPNDLPLEMQRRMLRIRKFDERAWKMVKRGEIPGTVHASIGQEAQVVGACMALAEGDYMTGNHRSHGHPIGKGGSMHLADFKVGSLGESGIVGSSVPIATGAALSAKVLGTGKVSLAFFGDGASNPGCLYADLRHAFLTGIEAVWSKGDYQLEEAMAEGRTRMIAATIEKMKLYGCAGTARASK
jgi:TPP-dependent pyruvate/acetoin dehydrogenase alpha subunit